MFKIGDVVKVMPNALFADGSEISQWVFDTKMFIRNIDEKENTATIARRTSGSTTGTVNLNDLVMWMDEPAIDKNFESYIVYTSTDGVEVYNGPNLRTKKINELSKNSLRTIIGEKNGFGRLKLGGWVELTKVNKK